MKAASIKSHLEGDIEQAIKGYQAFIKTGINDADVLSNYALILQEIGKPDEALKMYEKTIVLDPKHVFALSNLGYLLYSMGELDRAEDLTRKAIKLNPKVSNAHSNLSLILKSKGDLTAAEDSADKAIELDPKLGDGYLNLGLIKKEQGDLKAAILNTEKAIDLKPDFADAYLNKGVLCQEGGDLPEAEKMTRKAMELNPRLKDVHLNLATILRQVGKYEEAIIHLKEEIDVSPEIQSSYLILIDLIGQCDLSLFKDSQLRFLINILTKRTDISHNNLFKALKRLISIDSLEKNIISEKSIYANDFYETIVVDKQFIRCLGLVTINDLRWESSLTNLRKQLLTTEIPKNLTNKENWITFVASLAQQCFLNEYVFEVTQEELKIVSEKEELLEQDNIDELLIAILACYKPIIELRASNSVKIHKTKIAAFSELTEMQLFEPQKEELIKLKIENPGEINNDVSISVKEQYEENPYPRWRYTTLAETKIPIEEAINNEISPNRIEINYKKECSDVLIAGCGTGQQLIDAHSYSNSRITAIDLSSSSLAYAQRKLNEYKLEQERLFQLDILDLDKLNMKFDVIECTGVLHHMKHPIQGLASLRKSIKNDGFIKLGLYSKLARRYISIAQTLINKEKINATKEGIKYFRSKVIQAETQDLETLPQWNDFYTTSMLRDLCFHVQEKVYTMHEIKEMLAELNLEFLGFVLPQEIKQRYSLEFPEDTTQTNLNNWYRYEEENPDIFRAMYQFWAKAI
ncbi:tetratricopeptide repeat protein [Prochlorococcus sp. MIT 1300]|uniref:tetratricopeptide repeat protein n=1 Tax=Prochlorococcus sp. MIT 1300 TaxID=3096218 RepID=UPI002A753618|nr:tetratricopeptide repeat protein [Prochlorococcus sp. MIT 1300]